MPQKPPDLDESLQPVSYGKPPDLPESVVTEPSKPKSRFSWLGGQAEHIKSLPTRPLGPRKDESVFNIDTTQANYNIADWASKLPEPLRKPAAFLGSALINVPVDIIQSILGQPENLATVGAAGVFRARPRISEITKPKVARIADEVISPQPLPPQPVIKSTETTFTPEAQRIQMRELTRDPMHSQVRTADDLNRRVQAERRLAEGESPTGAERRINERRIEPPPLDILSPQDKLLQAMNEAKPLRGRQERIYTSQRAERIAKVRGLEGKGEEGFKKQLGALKGEMPKVEFESIRTKLEQPDIDELFNNIDSSRNLTSFEKINAKTGLSKLLGEYGGHVPQDNELAKLQRVFGPEMVSAIRQHMSTVDRARGLVSESVNFPKSLLASIDVSAPFRQGFGLVQRKEFWTSFDDMFKSLGSEDAFRGIQNSIREKPLFELGQESGLALTDLTHLGAREEQFMSEFAERIPVIGKAVRASNRAYVGFLNKLRSDTFDSLIKSATDAGLKPESDLMLSKEIARYINNTTGRGSLGALEKNAVGLNNFFFSPRLIASRVNMLNPNTYIKATPFLRKQYLKSLFAMTAAGSVVVELGKLAGGEVVNDPTSSDFRKLKVGNTRLDPYGGFQQYITLASRLLTGESTSTTSGKTYELGSRFGLPTRANVAIDFTAGKLAPVPKFVYDWLNQSSGRPFSVPEQTGRMFVPMMIQDIYDLAQDDPTLLPLAIPAGFGMGLQTYGR